MININDLDGLLFNHKDKVYLVGVTDDNRVTFTNMATGGDESTPELLQAVLNDVKRNHEHHLASMRTK